MRAPTMSSLPSEPEKLVNCPRRPLGFQGLLRETEKEGVMWFYGAGAKGGPKRNEAGMTACGSTPYDPRQDHAGDFFCR